MYVVLNLAFVIIYNSLKFHTCPKECNLNSENILRKPKLHL